MKLSHLLGAGLAAAAMLGSTAAIAQDSKDHKPGTTSIQRVLLISVDGMHAVDFLNCANGISTVNNGSALLPGDCRPGSDRRQLHLPPAPPSPRIPFPA